MLTPKFQDCSQPSQTIEGEWLDLKKKSQSPFVGATRIFGCLKAEKANEA